MAFYRLISLSDDGGAVETRAAEFAADQDAVDAAFSLLNKHAGVEIWNGARLVGHLAQDFAPTELPDEDSADFDAELAELFHETWQLAEEIGDPAVRRRLFDIANELLALGNIRLP
jgi:hypothetical protein